METRRDHSEIFDALGCLSESGLARYAAGQLDAEALVAARAHLADCELCATAAEGLQLLYAQKGPEGALSLMTGIHRDIDDKVAAEISRRRRLRLVTRGSWTAAAAGLALLIGFYFLQWDNARMRREETADKIALEGTELAEMQRDTESYAANDLSKAKEQVTKFTAPRVVEDKVTESVALNQEDFATEEQSPDVVINLEEKSELLIPPPSPKSIQSPATGEKSKEQDSEFKAIKTVEGVRMTSAGSSDTKSKKDQSLAMKEEEDKSPPFTVVEEMPQYPGGEEARLKFLQENIQYPQKAKESGIQGTVYVTFIVTTKGKIRDARILRGIGGGCDEEALRVLKLMPNWTPGKQAGKPVEVQFTMAIKFTLN
jgi:protein TonB